MKRILARVGLAALGLLISLGLGEGLVRIAYPHSRDAVIPGHLFAIDNDVGWRFAPSKTSTHHTRYFEAAYAINSLGFRDKPRQIAKADDTHRILLYGDSLIFGWGVQEQERFSNILEGRSGDLEVWNHAVPGYGLDQEIVLYQKEGDSLHADEVIFFVGTSTLWRIHTTHIYAKYKPMFSRRPDGSLTLVPVPKGKNAAISFLYQILSPFHLPYFLQTQMAALRAAARSRAAQGADVAPPTLESSRLVDELSKDMLRMVWNIAQSRRQRMTILVANLSEADRSELRSLCNETGIGRLEIGPEVSVTSMTDEKSDFIFGKYDKHWNSRANKLIAGQLALQMKLD